MSFDFPSVQPQIGEGQLTFCRFFLSRILPGGGRGKRALNAPVSLWIEFFCGKSRRSPKHHLKFIPKLWRFDTVNGWSIGLAHFGPLYGGRSLAHDLRWGRGREQVERKKGQSTRA
jgi:hypothetical protein